VAFLHEGSGREGESKAENKNQAFHHFFTLLSVETKKNCLATEKQDEMPARKLAATLRKFRLFLHEKINFSKL